ncbi:MAG: SDR family oxidoreductase [Burkholderiales bacterium]|nr:SDR family oxidoreductase [Burkholderiales bacterium]
MADYSGRVVLVTGSSRGVGRLITDHFLGAGAQVIGVARGASDLQHQNYRHRQVDVSDATAIQALFVSLRVEGTAVDIVVNNSAVLTSQYAMIMPASAAKSMVDVNLMAPFLVSREAAKLMRKSKWGRIINIGSMAARLEPEGDSMYAACKAALTVLAGVMAKEFASINVTCNTLAITAIETDMLRQLPRDKIDAVIARLPIPRYATPDDILNVIDFFASERSSYITAQTVFLGGVH